MKHSGLSPPPPGPAVTALLSASLPSRDLVQVASHPACPPETGWYTQQSLKVIPVATGVRMPFCYSILGNNLYGKRIWKRIYLYKPNHFAVCLKLTQHSMALFSGLRIWRCCELGCRLQMQLGSPAAVTVAYASGYSSNLTPNLGASMCCMYGPKLKKQNRN